MYINLTKIIALMFFFVTFAIASDSKLIIGVGTHFGGAYEKLKIYKDWRFNTGVSSNRNDIFWADLELMPGVFEPNKNGVNSYNSFDSLYGESWPLIVLAYGNKLYDNGGQPNSTIGISKFANYASWVVEKTAKFTDTYELWNEWNIGAGNNNKIRLGDPYDYVQLAKETYKSIKLRNKAAKLLVGGIAEDRPYWLWLKTAIYLGLLDSADGLSVHLYNHCQNYVGVVDSLDRIDQLHQWLESNGYNIPLYITEVGWPTSKDKCGVSEVLAANYTFRFLLEASVRPWLIGVWMYELIDGGYNINDFYMNFGLLKRDNTEKPAGCVVRSISGVVSSRPSFYSKNNNISTALYSVGENDYLVLWSNANQGSDLLKIKFNKPVEGVSLDICGVSQFLNLSVSDNIASVYLQHEQVMVFKLKGHAGIDSTALSSVE